MPFIPDMEKRKELNKEVYKILEKINKDGQLNYFISYLIMVRFGYPYEASYDLYYKVLGFYESLKKGFELEFFDMYEKEKMKENGGIFK